MKRKIQETSSSNQADHTFWELGKEYFIEKNFKGALEFFNLALKENPADHLLYLKKAYLQLLIAQTSEKKSDWLKAALNDLSKAFRLLEPKLKANDMDLDIKRMFFHIFLSLYSLNNSEAAFKARDAYFAYKLPAGVQEVVDMDYAVANSTASIYIKAENYEEALACLDSALILNTTYNKERAYMNRALCHSKVPNYELAIDDYTQAIALNPNSLTARIERYSLFDSCLGRKTDGVFESKDLTMFLADCMVLLENNAAEKGMLNHHYRNHITHLGLEWLAFKYLLISYMSCSQELGQYNRIIEKMQDLENFETEDAELKKYYKWFYTYTMLPHYAMAEFKLKNYSKSKKIYKQILNELAKEEDIYNAHINNTQKSDAPVYQMNIASCHYKAKKYEKAYKLYSQASETFIMLKDAKREFNQDVDPGHLAYDYFLYRLKCAYKLSQYLKESPDAVTVLPENLQQTLSKISLVNELGESYALLRQSFPKIHRPKYYVDGDLCKSTYYQIIGRLALFAYKLGHYSLAIEIQAEFKAIEKPQDRDYLQNNIRCKKVFSLFQFEMTLFNKTKRKQYVDIDIHIENSEERKNVEKLNL